MKKHEMIDEIRREIERHGTPWQKEALKRFLEPVEKYVQRINGTKGADEKRALFCERVLRILMLSDVSSNADYERCNREKQHEKRYKRWKRESAIRLAQCAGYVDEHFGYKSGDYTSIKGLDYIGKHESWKAPFFDMGGEGLGLVEVTRQRVYAKSYSYGPSSASTIFLVGRNEVGTYFAHPVHKECKTVQDAIAWIWSGMQDKIVARQGDIALVNVAGPKMPRYMPKGHVVMGNAITHSSHPILPCPGKGQRIIVGRRAAFAIPVKRN